MNVTSADIVRLCLGLSESFKIQELEWFSHESMRAKAASFNPLGDYCLVVTESMDLFVICVERILSGTEVMGKASSGLSWNKEVVSQVYRAASGDGGAGVLGAPSCVLWWETSDFIQLGIIGTDTGTLVVINLVSGTLVSGGYHAHKVIKYLSRNPSCQILHLSMSLRSISLAV